MIADIIIVGTGVSGLYCALNLPEDKTICLITKCALEMSNSYLAQGGICVLKEFEDYERFFEDTLKAGHYENNKNSVDLMIRTSPEIIRDLTSLGVVFEQKDGEFLYTKEGAHSTARILYHKDITGQEITQKLIEKVKKKKNVTIMEYTQMVDVVSQYQRCTGVIIKSQDGVIQQIASDYVVLATGGIGGLYKNSTNFSHLTGDSLAVSLRKGIAMKNLNYIQIHPTTLYSRKPGRRYLISESVRGEGAFLRNAKKERFVDELLPRDLLTQKIYRQMREEGSQYIWLDLSHLDSERIKERFPHIYQHCLEEGYDITKEVIPVVPAQHYFMGGIAVDLYSRTSMEHLYAVGETSCNGVHGANRLASNSLLESLVFARAAAKHIAQTYERNQQNGVTFDITSYADFAELSLTNKELVRKEIERVKQHEQRNCIKIKCG